MHTHQPPVHLPCTSHAPPMHLPRTSHAPPMHLMHPDLDPNLEPDPSHPGGPGPNSSQPSP
eukprot:scaffold32950_cov46-Phaeocystis_antarctica.AAC.2